MGAAPVCVVVGAGFGGLAAAARARAQGFQVKVVDRQQEPGGRARVLRAGESAWDAGPTVITAPELVRDGRAAGRRRRDRSRGRDRERGCAGGPRRPGAAGARGHVPPACVDRMAYSFGLFVPCFGTDRPYPEVSHHTILLGRRWRTLLDEVFGRGSVLPEDSSLYLHRPAATDLGMAPSGGDAFYALVPVPNLRAGVDWAEAALRLRAAVLAMLEERELPGLSQHLVAERSFTPQDFRHDYASRHGAGYSIAPTLLQSAWFRFHNRSPLPGLYLVGAGTHPGAGVLTSAKLVDQLLQADYARVLP